MNYRQGIETDLSEVLQTDRVFTNVSKGEFAKSSDLKKGFGTTNEEEVCRLILQKGQIQVSDMERSAYLESTIREVAVMITEKCTNPQSNRPYTVETIRNAMKEAEFNVHPTKNVKQQFLECVKLLKSKNVIPLERARMHLCAIVSSEEEENVKRDLMEAGVHLIPSSCDNSTNKNLGEVKLDFLMDPSLYRKVDDIIKNKCGSKNRRLEIVKQAVFEEGDVDLDSELARKDRLKAATGQQVGQHQGEVNSASDNEDAGDEEEVINLLSNDVKDLCLRCVDKKEKAEEGSENDYADGTVQEDHISDEENEEDDEDGAVPYLSMIGNVRQNQKNAQKSKKAKRREREEAEEREKLIESERARQKERRLRLCKEGRMADMDTGDSRDSATAGGKTKGCNTCGGSYTDADYRAHFRSDFHRFNLKLKMQGVPCISEEEFKLCDANSFFD